jgi:hypothetical protein
MVQCPIEKFYGAKMSEAVVTGLTDEREGPWDTGRVNREEMNSRRIAAHGSVKF